MSEAGGWKITWHSHWEEQKVQEVGMSYKTPRPILSDSLFPANIYLLMVLQPS